MSLRVTIVDEQVGTTETVRVADGDYLILCMNPCYQANASAYPGKGTHILTIKGVHPQPLPEVEAAS